MTQPTLTSTADHPLNVEFRSTFFAFVYKNPIRIGFADVAMRVNSCSYPQSSHDPLRGMQQGMSSSHFHKGVGAAGRPQTTATLPSLTSVIHSLPQPTLSQGGHLMKG